jgi:hypothetical protein
MVAPQLLHLPLRPAISSETLKVLSHSGQEKAMVMVVGPVAVLWKRGIESNYGSGKLVTSTYLWEYLSTIGPRSRFWPKGKSVIHWIADKRRSQANAEIGTE